MEQVFGALVVRGDLRPFHADEDRVFESIKLDCIIDDLQPNQFALEAEYEVTESFSTAHALRTLEDGTAVGDGQGLRFSDLRPDILQVRAPGRTDSRRS